MKKKRHRVFWFSGAALAAFSLVFILYYFLDRERIIYPSDNPQLYRFGDAASGGTSEIAVFGEKDGAAFIDINFGEGSSSPYGGIGVSYPRNMSLFPCDSLKLEIGHSGVNMVIAFLVFNSEKYLGHEVYFQSYINVNDSSNLTKLLMPFQEFTIPDWWFNERNLPYENLKIDRRFNKLQEVEIFFLGNAGSSGNGTLFHLSLYRSNAMLVKYLQLALLLCCAGIFLILTPLIYDWQRRFHTRKILIPYKSLGIESEIDFWKERVHPVISEYSREKKANIHSICDALMISERELSRLIKKYTGVGFTRLIGVIRIEYACSLLKQTNKAVIDIAAESGFGSLSRFNLLFKRIKGMTPTAYRRSVDEH